jgi:Exostosin family
MQHREMVKIYISSCGDTESVYEHELRRLASLCTGLTTEFVKQPQDADIILVIDIDERDIFSSLRHNVVRRMYPEKSFGLYEGDNPPRFLHGLYSATRKALLPSRRYHGFPYLMHQFYFPNVATPDVSEVYEHKKDLLFSFAGRISHKVRKKLFQCQFPISEVEFLDTSHYNHFQNHQDKDNQEMFQKHYWKLAMRSKYVLCPRGAGPSSIRLFEMLEAGIAPVIISDDWVPPYGPEWEDFALFVPECKIALTYDIVKAHEDEFQERGLKARKAYETYFANDRLWEFIITSIDNLLKTQGIPEVLFSSSSSLLLCQEWTRQKLTSVSITAKGLIRKSLEEILRKKLN